MLDKPKSFFEYLLAISNLKYQPIRLFIDYEKVWHEELLSELTEGCNLFGEGDDPEAILELHRQELTNEELSPPKPPEEIEEWIDFNYKNEQSSPRIPSNKIYITSDGNQVEESFNEDKNRISIFDRWTAKWEFWAEQIRAKKRTKKVYEEFFNLIQILQKDGESLELLLGRWIFTWKHPKPEIGEIRHPLFTLKLDLNFDPDSGVITVHSSYQCFRLETDMLVGVTLPNAHRITEIGQKVMLLDYQDDISSNAIQFVKLIDANGRISNVNDIVESSKDPTIYDKYMLVLRRKDTNLLKKDLEQIIDGLSNGEIVVPPSVSAIVGDAFKDYLDDTDAAYANNSDDDDLYFPLPANEEQKEIIRRLSNNFGVTVQGPPGTGKTHTIANIVSHLLAQGKKILITSQKENPLKVLKEKIPKEIQDLCVPVLGGGRESLSEIEKSIRTISEKLGTLSVDKLEEEIKLAKEELDKSKRREAELTSTLMDFTKSEKDELDYKGNIINKSDAAILLNENTLDLSWIKDKELYPTKFPLNDNEFTRMWEVKGILQKSDLKLREMILPSNNKIKAATEFAEWLEIGDSLKEKKKAGEKFSKELNAPLDVDYLRSIIKSMEEILLQRYLLQKDNPLRFVIEDCTGGNITKDRWYSFIQNIKDNLNEYLQINQKVVSHNISLPEKSVFELESEITILKNHLEAGKKLNFAFFMLKGKKVKYLCQTPILNGNPIGKLDELQIVIDYLSSIKKKDELIRIWNGNIAEIDCAGIEDSNKRFARELDNKIREFEETFSLSEKILLLRPKLNNLTIQHPSWTDESFYEKLKEKVSAAIDVLNYKKWHHGYESYINELKSFENNEKAHPIIKAFLRAIQFKEKGSWTKNLEVLAHLMDTQEKTLEFYTLLNKLSTSLPFTAKWIEENVSIKDDIPEDFKSAWEIQTLANWMLENEHFDYEKVEKGIQKEQEYQQKLIKDIVSKSSWKNQIEKITEPQKRSLIAWKNFITRYGKGTGNNVRYLSDARREMQVAQGAIPVWIMPVNQVIENFPVSNEKFDVIIFDESSQCDIMSVPVLMRGKKVIVVGDDEQISPYGIGVLDKDIEELVHRYLDGVPNARLFDNKISLYEIADQVFPKNGRLMLKEHFRCVPEIIQFSNDLSYGGQMVPLRVPFSHEKLEPPVMTVKVSDGYCTEGNNPINEPEADAIVRDIKGLLKDPTYKNQTIGVITLQGTKQAIIIENKLREEIGEKEFVKRRIICGNAYTLQGDERDIVFLSMVVAPKRRFVSLGKKNFQQTYNVAASRARNQLRLYHSVELENLSQDDYRYRLLSYCKNPTRVNEIVKSLEKKCESDFEIEVLRMIVAKGYKVRPQVEVGKYRIDLVIEGINDRLAVECDSERWHGPERWEEDMARQYALERVGWKFWRIRGRQFYYNKVKSLESLWVKLEELKIEKDYKSLN